MAERERILLVDDEGFAGEVRKLPERSQRAADEPAPPAAPVPPRAEVPG